MSDSTRRVAILLFDDVEVLDFAGPYEVFSVAGRRGGDASFDVCTVSENGGEIVAREGLRVVTDHALADCPQPDLLVLPGGFGTRDLLANRPVLEWIERTVPGTELTLSVCTGALLLARLGFLRDSRAVTHHMALGELEKIDPSIQVVDERLVDNDRFVVSAGVSAGIDAAFHVVARLCGPEFALETARYIEYDWQPS